MPLILVRDIRDLAKRKLPSTVLGGHDILIDLAAANYLGRNLTMKQLLLVRGGSATTVRRLVHHLVDSGYVIKVPSALDGRIAHYSVSKKFLKTCVDLESELKQLSVEFDRRSEERRLSSGPGDMIKVVRE